MPRERVGSVGDTGAALLEPHVRPDPAAPDPTVTVVTEARRDPEVLAASLRSVAAQGLRDVEVLVVTDGAVADLEDRLSAAVPDLPLTFVRHEGPRASVGLDLALARATGDFLAWLVPGDTWEPGRIRLLAATAGSTRRTWCSTRCGCVARASPTSSRPRCRPRRARPSSLVVVDLGRLLVRRTALAEVGGFDETLSGGWEADLSFRLLSHRAARPVPVVGTTRDQALAQRARELDPAVRPVPDHTTVPTWTDVAFNRHAVDWDALGHRRAPARPGVGGDPDLRGLPDDPRAAWPA